MTRIHGQSSLNGFFLSRTAAIKPGTTLATLDMGQFSKKMSLSWPDTVDIFENTESADLVATFNDFALTVPGLVSDLGKGHLRLANLVSTIEVGKKVVEAASSSAERLDSNLRRMSAAGTARIGALVDNVEEALTALPTDGPDHLAMTDHVKAAMSEWKKIEPLLSFGFTDYEVLMDPSVSSESSTGTTSTSSSSTSSSSGTVDVDIDD